VGPAVRYQAGMNWMRRTLTPPAQRRDTKVTLCIGPAGTGKSHCCSTDDNGDFFPPEIAQTYNPTSSGFWNDYDGHTVLIMEEFRGSTTSPKIFQQICDKTPMVVNTKFGFKPLRAHDIRINTNFSFMQWWSSDAQVSEAAVLRRIGMY